MSDIARAAEIGMLTDTERLRVIGHNLANVGTVGFKREMGIMSPFEARLLRSSGPSAGDSSSRLMSTYTDHTPGTLTRTGNPLDLAIEGDAYFAIETGAIDTGQQEEAYTRQGTFRLNANGELVTSGGQRVVMTSGDVRLSSPAPQIDGQGNIRDNGTLVGQLKLVTVARPNDLQQIGDGLYALADSGSAQISESARVRQGFTEAANVVSMNEMVALMETVRHFETSQKVLQGYDAMLDRAITDLGSTQ
jgi:flagellar basal-body rod protein FlgG